MVRFVGLSMSLFLKIYSVSLLVAIAQIYFTKITKTRIKDTGQISNLKILAKQKNDATLCDNLVSLFV